MAQDMDKEMQKCLVVVRQCQQREKDNFLKLSRQAQILVLPEMLMLYLKLRADTNELRKNIKWLDSDDEDLRAASYKGYISNATSFIDAIP